MRSSALVTGFAAFLFVSPAFASVIDFKSSTHSGATGQSSYVTSADGTSVTIVSGPSGSTLTWNPGDGLGVQSTGGWEYDEIEGTESLTLAFSHPVLITSLYITDLFKESGYTEQGKYKVDNGTTGTFSASQSTGSNGEKTVSVNRKGTAIRLWAPTSGKRYEFSLAGIAFSEVPELSPESAGTALLLLLGGMAVLMGGRRRFGLGI